jgi:hypothetical protein
VTPTSVAATVPSLVPAAEAPAIASPPSPVDLPPIPIAPPPAGVPPIPVAPPPVEVAPTVVPPPLPAAPVITVPPPPAETPAIASPLPPTAAPPSAAPTLLEEDLESIFGSPPLAESSTSSGDTQPLDTEAGSPNAGGLPPSDIPSPSGPALSPDGSTTGFGETRPQSPESQAADKPFPDDSAL